MKILKYILLICFLLTNCNNKSYHGNDKLHSKSNFQNVDKINLINESNENVKFGKICEDIIVELIDNSTNTIDIAVYSINNTNIINSLVEAKNRNVKIRILTDKVQAANHSSKVEFLHDLGFDIKVNSKFRIMHHKFAIFDNYKVINGSFNWTFSAANKNAEDCFLSDNENNIETFNNRFNELWEMNKLNNSECYFNVLKQNIEDDKIRKNEYKKCKLVND